MYIAAAVGRTAALLGTNPSGRDTGTNSPLRTIKLPCGLGGATGTFTTTVNDDSLVSFGVVSFVTDDSRITLDSHSRVVDNGTAQVTSFSEEIYRDGAPVYDLTLRGVLVNGQQVELFREGGCLIPY